MSKNLFQKANFQEEQHLHQSQQLRASKTSSNYSSNVQASYQSLKSVLNNHTNNGSTVQYANSNWQNQGRQHDSILSKRQTLPTKNFAIKKQLSTSSASYQSQINNMNNNTIQNQYQVMSQTSRFGLKPHFEIANIGIRKGSMQTNQPTSLTHVQNLNLSQYSKQNVKQQQQKIPNNNTSANKNLSQNRLTSSQKDIPNTNMLLASIEQFQSAQQIQNMIKQSRNINIPKSSSQQNPAYKSQYSSTDHTITTYQMIKTGAYPPGLNQKSPQSKNTQNQFQTQAQKPNLQEPQIQYSQHSYSKYKMAVTDALQSHPTQCETGASIDNNLQQSSASNPSFMNVHHIPQRPISNMAVFTRQESIPAQNSNQTVDIGSIQSSIVTSSDDQGNGQLTNAASLLEGAIGVQLPQSKINTAAQRQHQLTKNQAKDDVGDEGENINASDEEIVPQAYDRYDHQHNQQHQNRSTILDQDIHNNNYEDEEDYESSSSSINQSFEGSDRDGIQHLLEGFVRKGDLISIRQFNCLIKGEIQKSLIYRAIEHKQVNMLQYLLTETLKINQNLNLLHIACKQKGHDNEYKELEIVRSIMKYDKFADLNAQDTYGNTPIHLAAQNGKSCILQFFLNNYNPNIYIKNSEGQLALNTSSSQEILKKLKEALTMKDDFSDPSAQFQGSNSTRSHKHHHHRPRVLSRNKSEHQLTSSSKKKQKDKSAKRVPLQDISQNYQNSQSLQHNLPLGDKSSASQRHRHQTRNLNHRKSNTQSYQENQHQYSYYCETEPGNNNATQNNIGGSSSHRKKKSIQQYESIMDYCNQQTSRENQRDKKYMVFKDEEFEKVVEFTESDEEGSSFNDKIQGNGDDGDEDQTLQFCEEIQEVSDESMQNSIMAKESQKIGPQSFEPISLIGQGSFGEVYLVKKKDTNQLYAMKVLQKQRIMGQNLVKYAITERNVLSYTRHPFIVGLNYAFQTRDKLFLILDYAPGGDLGKVIGREKRLTEDRARIYLSEILLALEDLHKRDIIFRDLKPDNVVLDEEGHVMLTDFGLSKEGVLDNQAAKSFCGSVAYLAPEMLKRTGHGKSVDWYLLGVLLYEMLVGIPPYFNNNREKLFQNIQRGPLLIPSQLSKEAKTLLIGLLSKNSMKRLGAGPRDAEEIKEHEFFRDINWDDVQHRRLNPPKPEIKDINKHFDFPQPYPQFLNELRLSAYGDHNEDENKLPGWSFVTPNNENMRGLSYKGQ